MLVVASRKIAESKRIYHRCGCIYAKRIKLDNRVEMSATQADRKGYYECKYCAGLRGDVRVHKNAFVTWNKKHHMGFIYREESDTLYFKTDVGFWKVYLKQELGKYLLYHRNTYTTDIEIEDAIHGSFHRQVDMKATESMEKLVNYVVAHDKAKEIIADDYRKLPQNTHRQRKYYRAAKRKAYRQSMKSLNDAFAALEKEQPEMKYYSLC